MRQVPAVRPLWRVRTVCFQDDIDLSVAEQTLADAHILHPSPLIIQYKGSYATLFTFGVMTFWLGDESDFLEMMVRLEDRLALKGCPTNDRGAIHVLQQETEDLVTFREVKLRSLSVEHIKVISEVIAQSAALDRCDQSVKEMLTQWGPSVERLRNHGDIHLASKNVLKMVGQTLTIREACIGKLALIDTPDEVWQSERLSKLRFELHERFNVQQRVASLQAKLDYMLSLNETLMNLLRHRESHRLEWIVILLIVIEVIYSTIHFFA